MAVGGGGAGGVSLLTEREVVSWLVGGGGGVSLLAEGSGVDWVCGGCVGRGVSLLMGGGGGGLEVSHYWQTVKWDHGCMWGWGYLTVGRE